MSKKILREDVNQNARFAGQVLRYHTWPVFRQQSVGEHTWQCLRIYLKIFGNLPSEVAQYLVWHDAGELAVGDPPFPVKAKNPILKEQYDRLENEAVLNMGGVPCPLPSALKDRAKFVDLYEMYEFGMTELLMGNQYAHPIIDGTLKSMDILSSRVAREEFELMLPWLQEAYIKLKGVEA